MTANYRLALVLKDLCRGRVLGTDEAVATVVCPALASCIIPRFQGANFSELCTEYSVQQAEFGCHSRSAWPLAVHAPVRDPGPSCDLSPGPIHCLTEHRRELCTRHLGMQGESHYIPRYTIFRFMSCLIISFSIVSEAVVLECRMRRRPLERPPGASGTFIFCVQLGTCLAFPIF